MRGLSEKFMGNLLEGKLNGFLTAVQRDSSLALEIRGNYANIYYRGGNLCRIKPKSLFFDLKYAKNKKDEETIANIKTWNNADWLANIPLLKKIMENNWTISNNVLEKEYQQAVLTANNRLDPDVSDYFVSDIEYQIKNNSRFDMIAVDKNTRRIAIIEVKYGDNSLAKGSDIIKHVKDWACFLDNDNNWETLCKETKILLNQKYRLGLLSNAAKEIGDISSKYPELILLIANHNPDSSVLERELKKIRDLPEYKFLGERGCEVKVMDVKSSELILCKKHIIPINTYLGENL